MPVVCPIFLSIIVMLVSGWCQAGVMIVVWQTPGNTGTRGHLVIAGTLPDCLETYRQYKHIWNKQLASPPQLHLTSALYPRNRRVAMASSPAQAMRFLLFSVWRGSDPPGAQVAHHARQADQWAGTRARSTTRSPQIVLPDFWNMTKQPSLNNLNHFYKRFDYCCVLVIKWSILSEIL